MYDSGDGVPKDFEKAAEWHLKAAENGFARSQYAIGNYMHIVIVYPEGDGGGVALLIMDTYHFLD